MKKILTFSLIILIAVTASIKFGIPEVKAAGESGIVMEVTTGRVLSASNSKQKMPMASTTKVVTAITVIDKCDLNAVVTIKRESVGIEGSSIYLKEGEKLTVRELLYGLMLRSGNDSADALARFASGSIEKFAEEMNSLAKSLGALDSNFVNPHGLHHDDHYTTAYDLALITAYAMKNPEFREIVACKKIAITGAEEGTKRILFNKNKMLNTYPDATGIKTGFTKRAGRCLVSGACREGLDVVCVVLNCGPMYERSKELMNRAFNTFKMTKVLDSKEVGKIAIENLKEKSCPIGLSEDKYYPLKEGELERLLIVKKIDESIHAPFKKGSEAGKVSVYLDKQLLFCEKIYTIIGIDEKDYFDILNDVTGNWSLLN